MRLRTLFATTLIALSLPVASARAAAVRSDFNRDGKSDIVLQNTKTGDVAVWLMNDGTVVERKVVATPGADWHVVATADLDHDGTSEIIVQNSATRAIAAWKMNGTTRVSDTTIATPAMVGWRVVGTRDVTADGNDDILLQNTSGALAVWEMNGTKLTAGRPLGDSTACGLAAGNFGGNAFLVYDAAAEKALRRRGLAEKATTALDSGDIEQIAVGDFDGDGDDDVVEQLAGGTAKVLLFAAGGAKIDNTATLKLPGTAATIAGIGDYDGNGRADILTYSANDGVTAWQLDGTTLSKRWNLATEANWKPFATTAACMTADAHAGHAAAAATTNANAAPYLAKGANVTFASASMGYLSLPKTAGKKPAIIVIQEWWGVNDWIREQADRFASQGYVALAVDLYRGRAASTQEEAHELSRALPHDRAVGDLRAAFDYLAARSDVDATRIASVGWCLGGGFSLDLAIAEPRLAAAVVSYGALDTDPTHIAKIHAPILGNFGALDRGITPADVHEFETAMTKAGKSSDMKIYEGAGHAFMNPNNKAGYVYESAKDAWKRIDSFLAKHLRRS